MTIFDGSGAALIDTTQNPGSALDSTATGSASSGTDWLGQGLNTLLNLYAAHDAATIAAQGNNTNVPAGYYRVPGTGQILPIGQAAPANTGILGMSTSTLLLVGLVIGAAFLILRK